MILSRYLRREVVKTALAILFVLILIFALQRFVYYLRDAAAGQISTTLVGELLLLQIPRILALLLPLAVFLGAMLALGRMYADQEITVMQACGVGPTRVVLALMRPALILGGFSLLLALTVTPWATEQQYQLLDQQAAERDITLLMPGRFQQSADGRSIIYVQDQDSNGKLKNVFLARLSASGGGAIDVISATAGQVTRRNDNQRYLLLEQGERYSGMPGTANFDIVDFKQYLASIPEADARARKRGLIAIPSLELLRSKNTAAAAELQWRLGTGVSLVLLVIIAVPLARVRPREGKFARIVPGLMFYTGYLTLMILSKNWIENEKIAPVLGMWWVHFLVLGIALWKLGLMGWHKRFKNT